MKQDVDTRYHTIGKQFTVGDYVIVQQPTKYMSSRLVPKPYQIVTIKRKMLTETRSGHTITRNVQRFKLLSKQRPSNYVQGDSDIDLDDTFNGNPNSTDNECLCRKL